MKTFCELMVQDIFPTVRALMAKEMMDKLNYNQSEVAAKMRITQPAVSQYMHELRGKKAELITSNPKVYSLIRDSAKKLSTATAPESMLVLCNICKEIRRSGLLCKLHKEAVPSLENCDVCFTK